MPYRVSATEKTTGSGNTNETKALFYLMAQDENSDEITHYVVDVFNDVTGTTASANRLWDVQSKNKKSGPREIGAELVTLFKNHMSEFGGYFVRKVLFLRGVTNTVLIDGSLSTFGFGDIKTSAQKALKEGLKAEALAKEYINDAWVTDENIDQFLQGVTFALAKPEKASYIKPFVGAAVEEVVNDRKLEAIFNEVRDAQAAKKNINCDGAILNRPHEAFRTGKYLSRKDIEQLILGRLINRNPMTAGVPRSFVRMYNSLPPESADEILDDCQNALALQLFDKNAKDAFWALFDCIVEAITKNKNFEIEDVYDSLDTNLLDECVHLDPLATQYFIAEIKDGLK